MLAALTTAERVEIWLAVASGVAALTTLVLAGTTLWMAHRTREVADASREATEAAGAQLEVTRAALQASILPWLTLSSNPVNRWLDAVEHPETFEVRVVLRNVGGGIALLRPNDGLRIIASEPVSGGAAQTRFGFATAAVVEPNTETELRFRVDRRGGGADLATYTGQNRGILGEFFVEVDYTDVRAEQLTTARLHVCGEQRTVAGVSVTEITVGEGARRVAQLGWRVATIQYRRAGEAGPFTSVQFSIQ